jgi:hypothetical protein
MGSVGASSMEGEAEVEVEAAAARGPMRGQMVAAK